MQSFWTDGFRSHSNSPHTSTETVLFMILYTSSFCRICGGSLNEPTHSTKMFACWFSFSFLVSFAEWKQEKKNPFFVTNETNQIVVFIGDELCYQNQTLTADTANCRDAFLQCTYIFIRNIEWLSIGQKINQKITTQAFTIHFAITF